MMDELVAWLREQIADRRQRAEAAGGDRWYQDGKTGEIIATNGKTAENCAGGYWTGIAEHIEDNDPTDVLAHCEAHTAILDLHLRVRSRLTATPEPDWCGECSDDAAVCFPCPTIRALGLAYRHRPGYRPEWQL